MKLRLLLIVSLTSSAVLTGCAVKWPNDAYIRDAKTTINTPWGPATTEAGLIATGKAAANLSAEDRQPTVKPPPTKEGK